MLRRVLLLLAVCPLVATAQSASVTIAVRVVDSANAPVADADVSVVQSISATLAHAATGANGRARLTVPRLSGELQLTVRRIGFQRMYRFFSLGAADSLTFDLALQRTIVTLAPVTVSAQEDLKRKSYHLDADEIENSTRAIIDGTDLFKLRPDMMNGRGGASVCAVPWTDHDGWIENVWINGQRVVMPTVDSIYVHSRKPGLGIPAPISRPNPRIIQPGTPRAAAPPKPAFTAHSHIDTVLSILHSIKPEHIAEVTYHDCFDMSVGKNRSDMAMFIVLKPGIGYDDSRGSYVVADEAPANTTTATISASDLDALPRYRFRLLGIYDENSGDPVADISVIDTLSGASARTTTTGTVSLFFVPEGTRGVRLHRDGYRDTTIMISISPADTIPLTLTVRRVVSPAVLSGSRSSNELGDAAFEQQFNTETQSVNAVARPDHPFEPTRQR
jgi:hypothetical protein